MVLDDQHDRERTGHHRKQQHPDDSQMERPAAGPCLAPDRQARQLAKRPHCVQQAVGHRGCRQGEPEQPGHPDRAAKPEHHADEYRETDHQRRQQPEGREAHQPPATAEHRHRDAVQPRRSHENDQLQAKQEENHQHPHQQRRLGVECEHEQVHPPDGTGVDIQKHGPQRRTKHQQRGTERRPMRQHAPESEPKDFGEGALGHA